MNQKLTSKQGIQKANQPVILQKYNGQDLELFKDTDNWYPWQKRFYKYFFTDLGDINDNKREILWIFDEDRNSGKSSFLKYLYYHHADKLETVTYINGPELKRNIINSGPRKLYLIDLSHLNLNQANFDEIGLLSVIEELKNGFIVSSDTNQSSLLMESPHIVLFSNSNQHSFVSSNLKTFEIKDKNLVHMPQHAIQRKTIQTQKNLLSVKNVKKSRNLFTRSANILKKAFSVLEFSSHTVTKTVGFTKGLAKYIIVLLVLDKLNFLDLEQLGLDKLRKLKLASLGQLVSSIRKLIGEKKGDEPYVPLEDQDPELPFTIYVKQDDKTGKHSDDGKVPIVIPSHLAAFVTFVKSKSGRKFVGSLISRLMRSESEEEAMNKLAESLMTECEKNENEED